MVCPQCGKEMRPGFLQGGRTLVFNQKQYRVSIAPRKEGDVEIVWNLRLTRTSMASSARTAA